MLELTHALALSVLMAGTLEYAILVRHRQERRDEAEEHRHSAVVGLRGLVRVLLADEAAKTSRAYLPE